MSLSKEFLFFFRFFFADITNNTLTILHLSEEMGDIFTSTNVKTRVQGIHLMANVLSHLPRAHLSADALSVLATFYAGRLTSDHHSVIPAVLEGYLAISHMTHLNGDIIQTILNSIFQSIPCSQQLLADRYRIYKILERFIKHHSKGK